ncbi:ABC-type Mn2+/Zn2+ transport system, permease component [Sphaerochaeta pleomorpha str. Grapes]|uniref:ABC-type Mn2+/Zn2+ transport system, permease component n=1 Tax=Sphaerochaeta pleomorpha (strain ATCC BAA-1885 / DSM 22778 / Grapes) TaxID=158190 RepID=G8QS07_SPHPG|nr:metal ABC transporter permease [Sphaerochaeta pleomorpha]AEV30005.1 ABC-type Mn2+/Zn2+ transport system, permease component [Sphaerochaeta pleomorpha str. Grapes]
MNSFLGFFSALVNPDFPFLRNALVAGFLSSVLFGVLGSIVTVKRIAGLAGAISHAVLGGIGIALYLSATGKVPGLQPMVGAIVFAVLAAGIIGFVSLKAKQREDTVINAIWAIGMSIGVLFMAKTPGYTDPSSYLFGNILLISEQNLIMLAVLDCIVVFLSWRFYPQIEASSFDEEFAQVRGIPTQAVFLLILSTTAIAVVLLQTFVGIVMVIAMLTLPAGTAGYSARDLSGMMILGTIYASLFSLGGLATGWALDLPVGAMVVVIAGAVFLGTAVGKMLVQHRRKS